MEESKETANQFLPFTPSLSMGFWSNFANLKLSTLKLDDSPLKLEGTYHFPSGGIAYLEFDQSSLIDHDVNKFQSKGGYLRSKALGALKNYNTLEQFKKVTEPGHLKQEISKIQESIKSQIQFIVFAFSDLKQFKFSYFLYFLECETLNPKIESIVPLSEGGLSAEQIASISNSLQQFRDKNESSEVSQFLSFNEKKISQYKGKVASDSLILMIDPSSSKTQPSELVHSLLRETCSKVDQMRIVLLREKITSVGRPEEKISLSNKNLLLSLKIENKAEKIESKKSVTVKSVDLKQFLDPEQLASQAVKLNLSLMKWRAAPSLDLSFTEQVKCLLFGSGSLGCQVARQLLAWGFQNITLVDNGRVSFSNPVRQSLFEYKDAQKGDAYKSETAKEALKRINPGVQSESVIMTIPMPGHPPSKGTEAEVLEQVNKVQNLIATHDVVFLLTDNRESRWLPTLLSAIHNKLCITVALGFDTFVVMRHGTRGGLEEEKEQTNELGCYFCGDVVAPQDSMRDRTLDQQCTVSRPALCPMASSIAVELLVSLLNHPKGASAQAHQELDESDTSVLGPLPQQIRGNLHSFALNCICGYAFDKCVACSNKIRKEYQNNRNSFMMEVLKNSDHLEDVSGITEMKEALEGVDIEEFMLDP